MLIKECGLASFLGKRILKPIAIDLPWWGLKKGLQAGVSVGLPTMNYLAAKPAAWYANRQLGNFMKHPIDTTAFNIAQYLNLKKQLKGMSEIGEKIHPYYYN